MTPTPKPPTDTFRRVIHGGSWFDSSASDVRAAYRNDYAPSVRIDDVGFRCAQRGVRMTLVKATP